MQALREEEARDATALEQVLTPRKLQQAAAAAPHSASGVMHSRREKEAEDLSALQQLRALEKAQSHAAIPGSASHAMRQLGSGGDEDTGVLECFLPPSKQHTPCCIVWGSSWKLLLGTLQSQTKRPILS